MRIRFSQINYKIIFLCSSGAKRLLACESCRSRSGCRGSIVLPGDSLFFQGHAANCPGQKEQSGVPGALGRNFFFSRAANRDNNYDSMAAICAFTRPFSLTSTDAD